MFEKELEVYECFYGLYSSTIIKYIENALPNVDKECNRINLEETLKAYKNYRWEKDLEYFIFGDVLKITASSTVENRIKRYKVVLKELVELEVLAIYEGSIYINPYFYRFPEYSSKKIQLLFSDTKLGRVFNRKLSFNPVELKRRKWDDATCGFVYLMTDASKLIKIGITQNMKHRFDGIQSTNPTVKLIGFVYSNNYRKVEKYLHNLFKEDNYSGEWFGISQDKAAEELVKFRTEDINNTTNK